MSLCHCNIMQPFWSCIENTLSLITYFVMYTVITCIHSYMFSFITYLIMHSKYLICYRGFSTIDLVEDRHSHRLFALKRMTCHSQEDEQNAVKEADLMNSLNHRNLVPCHSHTVVPLSNRSTAISEVLIVMPYYKAGILSFILFYQH